MDGHQLGTDSRSSAVQAGGGEFGGGGRADGQGMVGQRDRGAASARRNVLDAAQGRAQRAVDGRAQDRGCTRPGCTAPGYWCQVHHVDGWVKGDGPTDITKLTLACGPDNRLVEEGGWTTRKRKDGRNEWIPPPHLDTGQSRVNDYQYPEKYLRPEGDDPS